MDTTRLNIPISKALHRRLKHYAVESNLSIGAVVTALIEAAMNRVTVTVKEKTK